MPAPIRRIVSASRIVFVMIFLGLPLAAVADADEFVLSAYDDEEISVTRFAAEGEYLMIWLAPEYGFRKAHHELAAQMPAQHIEVWQSDISESLFLPLGTSSIKQLDGNYVAELIEYAYSETGKKIVVAGDSYGAMSALRGARQAQKMGRVEMVGVLGQYLPVEALGLARLSRTMQRGRLLEDAIRRLARAFKTFDHPSIRQPAFAPRSVPF